MANNRLCGLERDGNGTYTADGVTELFEALKSSTVTLLKCAAACSLLSVSAYSHAYSLTIPIPSLTRSLEANFIGAEGASALAAVLKETMISNLMCAAAPRVFAFVSAPLDTLALSPYPLSLFLVSQVKAQ